VKQGVTPQTLWSYEEVGHTQEAKKEILALFGSDVFITPKPERLIERILHIATNPGDLVLDSYLGSGTTAAVAQKMGRRYIGIEMGGHAVTHCQPRLHEVVDGEQGGISEAVNWKGGGGFRFYRLGAPVFDETGQIRPDIEFPVLAAHVWFSEVRFAWSKPATLSPVLGSHDGRAYALLYNGILGDVSVSGGNVLTRKTLAMIRDALPHGFVGPVTVYGERSALSEASLAGKQITFKQTPYDVKARA
jgi:adenine-specific DNA-methyltransferase